MRAACKAIIPKVRKKKSVSITAKKIFEAYFNSSRARYYVNIADLQTPFCPL